MFKWLKNRKTKIAKLEDQHKKDEKTITTLMAMNHDLIQTFNRAPAKRRRKAKNGVKN